jgi:hypothetical protein
MLFTHEINITITLINTSVSMFTALVSVLQIDPKRLSNLANVTELIGTRRGFDQKVWLWAPSNRQESPRTLINTLFT